MNMSNTVEYDANGIPVRPTPPYSEWCLEECDGLYVHTTDIYAGYDVSWPVTHPFELETDNSVYAYDFEGNLYEELIFFTTSLGLPLWLFRGTVYELDGTWFNISTSQEVYDDGIVREEFIGIFPYSTNVPAQLKYAIPESLCLGIEAEFSTFTQEGIDLAADDKSLFKWDSSCGIEKVSVPLPPAEMLNYINNLNIAQLGVDNKCGVHVHLSRKYLNQYQIGFLVMFMHHPSNLPYVTKVAGRAPNKYCQIKPNKLDTVSDDRYEMVNLTCKDTIEVRIFAGTNDKDTLRGYVEWLLQLLEWASTYPSSCGSEVFEAFLLEAKRQPTKQSTLQRMWKKVVAIATTRLF
jgi:hypothetical protein